MQKSTDADNLMRRFRSLIKGHADLCAKETTQLTKILTGLLPGFLSERKKWAESQRKSADDFNLLQVMGVETKEVLHSALLAWLLDCRIESGTHAQGNLGLRLFLKEFARELQNGSGNTSAYANANYWVNCEVSGSEARVDIEIAARGIFLIHIENKIRNRSG